MSSIEFLKNAKPSLRTRASLLIGMGLLALIWPDEAALAIGALLGVFVVVDGITLVLQARKGAGVVRAFTFVQGVGSLVIGLLLAFSGQEWITDSRLVLAVWSLLSGAAETALAVKEDRAADLGGLLGISGVLGLTVGVLLLVIPDPEFTMSIGLFGAYHLARGVVLVTAVARTATGAGRNSVDRNN